MPAMPVSSPGLPTRVWGSATPAEPIERRQERARPAVQRARAGPARGGRGEQEVQGAGLTMAQAVVPGLGFRRDRPLQ